jgi:hypothetical protein
MFAFAAPLLAAAVFSQFQARAIQGSVTDEGGKPVADAEVLFFAPAPSRGKAQAVEVKTKTDAAGRFRLAVPSLAGVEVFRANLWVYRPGSAMTYAPRTRALPPTLVLRTPKPRTITVLGPDGHPLAGALISPRVVYVETVRFAAEIPGSLSMSLAVRTGADGAATLDGLSSGDQLDAVRITADSVGSHDLELAERPNRNAQQAAITIRLKRTSWLVGRVRNRAGQPAPNLAVEIWSKRDSILEPNQVGFKGGPLLTAADGSFQTPDNLFAGSTYRVAIRAPGMEPILSDWITIDEKPRVLLPILLRPLRTMSGRVVDQQGMPVAGVEVFQAGDGPERTATKTDADGRFALGGFCQGPVFLFARGEPFRFHGQLIKPGDQDIVVKLTRTNEKPPREMRMLADPIPREESRALARRLLAPYWAAYATKDDGEKPAALRSLLMADPLGVLRKLEHGDIANVREQSLFRHGVAHWLARSDPAQAEAVAESIDAPGLLGTALLTVADALPETQRDRKLALLDRLALDAKAVADPTGRLYRMSHVAERWLELGEREKAQKLFAEEFKLVKQIANAPRPAMKGPIAAFLAPFDLPAAMSIATGFPADGTYTRNGILRYIAFGLAADNPAEAERVLRQIPPDPRRDWLHPMIARKMATVDPVRARTLTDLSQRYFEHPQTYVFLAHGMNSRDRAAADQALQAAIHGIDRLMEEKAEYSPMFESRQVLLPMVEQVDATLVSEFFWRAVASRPSVGNPRSVSVEPLSSLVLLLAWYDRDVAAALFETIQDQMKQSDAPAPVRASTMFLGWSVFDPRAAVARLESIPLNSKLDLAADSARQAVAESLDLPREARWRAIWTDASAMRELVYPSLW